MLILQFLTVSINPKQKSSLNPYSPYELCCFPPKRKENKSLQTPKVRANIIQAKYYNGCGSAEL
jgi:hypothetical protein